MTSCVFHGTKEQTQNQNRLFTGTFPASLLFHNSPSRLHRPPKFHHTRCRLTHTLCHTSTIRPPHNIRQHGPFSPFFSHTADISLKRKGFTTGFAIVCLSVDFTIIQATHTTNADIQRRVVSTHPSSSTPSRIDSKRSIRTNQLVDSFIH